MYVTMLKETKYINHIMNYSSVSFILYEGNVSTIRESYNGFCNSELSVDNAVKIQFNFS